ncbi:MAG: hypothetical protein ACRC5H_08430 [Treponemataceae bacterium]
MNDFNQNNDINIDHDEKKSPQKMTFYYNREERLKKYPEHRKLYNGEIVPKRGLFQVLTATPGSKFLFIAMLFLSAVLIIFMVTGNDTKSIILDGISIKIEAFRFNDTIYTTITLLENPSFEREKKIEAIIGIYDKEKNVLDSKKIQKIYTGEKQLLRITFTNDEASTIISKVSIGEVYGVLSVNNIP